MTNCGSSLLKPFRSGETEKRNNAVRTELLKALGQAFNLQGVGEHGGKTTFSDEFMRRLSDILGPAFKRGDFGIEDGVVASGKPLAQRRIKAICNAALAKAEMPYDGKAYSAKIDSIMGRFSGKRMAPVAVLKVREYALTIRKTIEFLENGMDGFDEAFANAWKRSTRSSGITTGWKRRFSLSKTKAHRHIEYWAIALFLVDFAFAAWVDWRARDYYTCDFFDFVSGPLGSLWS